jgi:hypothetical protein
LLIIRKRSHVLERINLPSSRCNEEFLGLNGSTWGPDGKLYFAPVVVSVYSPEDFEFIEGLGIAVCREEKCIFAGA